MAEHAARKDIEARNAYKMSVGKLNGKKQIA
jgi:hypothetical protein